MKNAEDAVHAECLLAGAALGWRTASAVHYQREIVAGLQPL